MNTVYTNVREMQDGMFEWVNPRHRMSMVGAREDVSIGLISVGKEGRKHDGISITFRNGVEKRVGRNLEIAILDNRVFFRQTDEPALTMLKNKSTNNLYGRIGTGAIVQTLKRFIGDYKMLYNDVCKLYYIEREQE